MITGQFDGPDERWVGGRRERCCRSKNTERGGWRSTHHTTQCYPDGEKRCTLAMFECELWILEETGAAHPDGRLFIRCFLSCETAADSNKRGKNNSSSIRLVWTSCVYTVITKIFNVPLFSKHSEHLRSERKDGWIEMSCQSMRKRKEFIQTSKFSTQKTLFIPIKSNKTSWYLCCR